MDTSLYLFPLPVLDDPPPMNGVEALLRRSGLLGEPLGGGRFYAGGDFFRHVTFAGCAPHLKLQPDGKGDLDFTHLRLLEEARPRLRVAPLRGRPRCGSCRAAVPGWKSLLPRWREDAIVAWRCPGCGREMPVAELDWRQYGVAARLLVEVRQVWPGEAMPGDALLRMLESESGRAWGYAWAEST